MIKFLSLVRIRREQEVDAIEKQRVEEAARVSQQSVHPAAAAAAAPGAVAEAGAETARAPVTRAAPKVGRNDPCPCGSGQKYKQCHGKLE